MSCYTFQTMSNSKTHHLYFRILVSLKDQLSVQNYHPWQVKLLLYMNYNKQYKINQLIKVSQVSVHMIITAFEV